jgi:hypothetical protein
MQQKKELGGRMSEIREKYKKCHKTTDGSAISG